MKKISYFHYQWIYKEEDSKSNHQCFIVRDINSTIKAISEGQEPSDAVNFFYVSRYKRKELNHLLEILKKDYKEIYKDLNKILELPKDFPKCYQNKSLQKAFYFANIAKKNDRHLLIVGKEGRGITQVENGFLIILLQKKK